MSSPFSSFKFNPNQGSEMEDLGVKMEVLPRMYGSACSLLRRFLWMVLSVGPIPNHIAFIMDGNRRYGQKHGQGKMSGHRAGFAALMSTLRYCYEMGVPYVTIFAFSNDNFNRRPDEIKHVMDLMHEKIEDMLKEESIVNQYGLKVLFLGNLKLLYDPVRKSAEKLMEVTAGNMAAVLAICVAYTSSHEIAHAVNESWVEKTSKIHKIEKENPDCLITLEDLERHMYTVGFPEPDILVRTSGETRLSDFLLWQTRFCYLHASHALWPEFSLIYLVWAILQYQKVQPYLEKQKKKKKE